MSLIRLVTVALLFVLQSKLLWAESQQKLCDLSNDSRELKQAFNRQKDTVRLILIVSPG